MSTSITDNKNVQDLIKRFDLATEKSYRLVATDYTIDSSGIHIKTVDVYDTDWKFVKQANMSVLKPEDFTLIFRKK